MDREITQYPCYVCGYLCNFKPWDGASPSDEICSCCGIQYGYDDYNPLYHFYQHDPEEYNLENRKVIYHNLRKAWIQNGMKFKHPQSEFNEPPENWNPKEQLKNIPKEFLGLDEKY